MASKVLHNRERLCPSGAKLMLKIRSSACPVTCIGGESRGGGVGGAGAPRAMVAVAALESAKRGHSVALKDSDCATLN